MNNDDRKILDHIYKMPFDQLKNIDYFNNRGERFVERALINDKQGLNELAFSDTIKKFHEHSFNVGGIGLEAIVGSDPVSIKAALTAFQWLTTNVGSAVLDEALIATGRKTIRIMEADDE